jgi:uncharacterized protein YjbI with pentapeptide repeats
VAAILKSSLPGARFAGAKLTQTALVEADLVQSRCWPAPFARNTIFVKSRMAGLKLQGHVFAGDAVHRRRPVQASTFPAPT